MGKKKNRSNYPAGSIRTSEWSFEKDGTIIPKTHPVLLIKDDPKNDSSEVIPLTSRKKTKGESGSNIFVKRGGNNTKDTYAVPRVEIRRRNVVAKPGFNAGKGKHLTLSNNEKAMTKAKVLAKQRRRNLLQEDDDVNGDGGIPFVKRLRKFFGRGRKKQKLPKYPKKRS